MSIVPRECLRVAPDNGSWEALHVRDAFGGPAAITLNGQPLLEACRFALDDLDGARAVLRENRLSRKGGAAVFSSRGYFPFGGEPDFKQVCRYAANHVRVVFDVRWRSGTLVRRHFGLGTVFLPGRWHRYFCVPPAGHLAAGVKPAWQQIPETLVAGTMIGHWHRPPLALVFEREDGTAIEIGTGDDVWRWEQGLGHGPESGSYKITVVEGGIEFRREPLMCCAEFQPEPRPYRFTWYAAWRGPRRDATVPTLPPGVPVRLLPGQGIDAEAARSTAEHSAWSLDLAGVVWPERWRRVVNAAAYHRGETAAAPCWAGGKVQKALRQAVRQFRVLAEDGALTIAGIAPGVCWEPSHLGRRGDQPLVHWDLDALLGFGVWARQQLGNGWQIQAIPSALAELPSLQGLFGLNGFSGDGDEETDAVP